jgi:phage shock protein PspC (stress-responsive transcriptional regulator)
MNTTQIDTNTGVPFREEVPLAETTPSTEGVSPGTGPAITPDPAVYAQLAPITGMGTGGNKPNVGAGSGGAVNRLYRSRTDSMLGGVCGGLARYLGIDPVVVRLTFAVLVLAGFGTGLLIYFIMWLVVPLEGSGLRLGPGGTVPLDQTMRSGAEEIAQRAQTIGYDLRDGAGGRGQVTLLLGGALLLLGFIFLAQNLFGSWIPWLGMGTLWPLLLIVAGIALVARRSKEA